jgi:hypothetical protein
MQPNLKNRSDLSNVRDKCRRFTNVRDKCRRFTAFRT